MSNSEHMTLAEKLAQKLKTSAMGEFLDEDALGDICKRALELAFFKPRETRGRYGDLLGKRDSEVVEMARDLFREEMKPKIAEAVREIAETDEFRQALHEVALASIPAMLLDAGRQAVTAAALATANTAILRIQEAARDGSLGRGGINMITAQDIGALR